MTKLLPVVLSLLFLLAPLAAAVRAEEGADEDVLRQKLRATQLTLAVENQSFGNVVKILQLQTGLNIVVDPRIAMDVAEVPVTGLFVDELSASTVLDMLAAAAGEEVIWTLTGTTILFTSREFVRPRLEVRVYPLAALIAARTSFVPKRSGLLGPAREDEAEAEEPEEDDVLHRPLGTIDELVELIKGGVAPAFWEETEGADIRTLDATRLVVRASSSIHAAIDRFLAHLDDLTHETILIELLATKPASVPHRTRHALSDDEVAALLAGRAPRRDIRLAVRTNIDSTAHAGQRLTYVAGYDPRFGGSKTVFAPQIDTVDTGMAARVRAVPGASDERILLQLDLALAQGGTTRTHGTQQRGLFTLPGRFVVRRTVTTLVEPGVWHWLEGSTGGAQDRGWVFLVRATPVPVSTKAGTSEPAYLVPTPRRFLGKPHPLSTRRLAQVHWEQANLDQVAAYLRAMTGHSVYITPRARAERFDEVELTLKLADISAETVLDLVTEPYELTWNLTDGLITIDVREHRYAAMALRYFDVTDLAVRLKPAYVGASTVEAASQDVRPLHSTEALVELIRESIGGWDAWEDPATIEARNGILIVRNTPSVLDAVARFLAGLRASQSLVTTTVDHVRMDAEVARRLLVDAAGHHRLLLDDQAVAAIDAAVIQGEAALLGSERIVSLEGAGVPIWTGQEQSYVANHLVRVSPDGAAVASAPHIETLRTGMHTRLRTLVGYPGDTIYLEVAASRTELLKIASATTRAGVVDLPVTTDWGAGTGLAVPQGKTAALFATSDGGSWDVLLVTPVRVRLDTD